MLDWLKATYKTAGLAGLIKALLVPLAYLYGRWSAFKEQWAVNEKLQAEYDRIENTPLTDEEIDKRLEDGTI
jgi:hypothetical protein